MLELIHQPAQFIQFLVKSGSTIGVVQGTNKREVNASLLSYPGPCFNLTPSNALHFITLGGPPGPLFARELARPNTINRKNNAIFGHNISNIY